LLPRESDQEEKQKFNPNALLSLLTSKKNGGGSDEE
jgi:hypothetical protein